MTTASELVTEAFREANILPVGGVLSADEQAEGLRRLNALMESFFGFELGDPMTDWLIPDPDHTNTRFTFTDLRGAGHHHGHCYGTGDSNCPPQNSKLIVTSTSPSLTIVFPRVPNDGARMRLIPVNVTGDIHIDAGGRLIEGTSGIILGAPLSSPVEWFYRADLSDWRRRATLLADSESPFPPEFDDMLIAWLAIRLMARYGNEPRSGTAEMFQTMLRKFKARYTQKTGVITRARFNDDHGIFRHA